MTPGDIEGATGTLTAPRNWDPATQGKCEPLRVRAGAYTMTSAWYPSDEERAAIAAGAPVYLTVFCSEHPPVSVNAGPVP